MRSMHAGKPQDPHSGCHGRALYSSITQGHFSSEQELPPREVAEKGQEGLDASWMVSPQTPEKNTDRGAAEGHDPIRIQIHGRRDV